LLLLGCAATSLLSTNAWADTLDRETLASKIEPPNELGEQLSDNGIWSILDRTGQEAGYIFETQALAPLPGFSGAPINVLVTLDRDGKFLRAELLDCPPVSRAFNFRHDDRWHSLRCR